MENEFNEVTPENQVPEAAPAEQAVPETQAAPEPQPVPQPAPQPQPIPQPQPVPQPIPQAAPAGNVIGFDPNTGAPIYAAPAQKKNKGLLIGLIAAAAVLVVALAVVLVMVFLGNPEKKVTKAMIKTFGNFANGDNKLATALNVTDIFEGGEYTISFEGDVTDTYFEETVSADGAFIKSKDALQITGGADLSDIEDIPYLEGILEWNASEIIADVPLFGYAFVYNYTEDVDGILTDLFDEIDMDPEEVNEAIAEAYKTLFSNQGKLEESEFYKGMMDIVEKDLKGSYEFEKCDAEEFEINDKDVKCKGYEMVIPKKAMKKYMNDYLAYVGQYYDEVMGSAFEEISGESFEDLMMEAADEMDEMWDELGDLTMRYYIYKGEIAAISCEIQNVEVTLELNGGDYRAQNMTLKVPGGKAYIESEIEDGVETLKFKVDSEELFSYEYDSESGDLSFMVNDGWDEMEFDGINIKKEKDAFVVGLDIEVEEEDMAIEGTVTLKKGADMKEISEDTFDLNSADEDDFMEMAEEIEDLVYDLGL